jgi:hypothetical protein
MRYRATLLGGSFELAPAPGHSPGTIARCRIPLPAIQETTQPPGTQAAKHP